MYPKLLLIVKYLMHKRLVLGLVVLFLHLFAQFTQASDTTCNLYNEQEVDSLSALALKHHTWAVRNYSVPGMLDSAIVRAREAMRLREKLWKSNPTIDLGKSYHNLGTFLKIQGNFDDAKKYLKEAVDVYTTLNHDRVLRSLLELGKIYKLEGDFVSAEEYFELVIKTSIERKNDQKTRAAIVDLGSTYVDAFQDTMAIAHLEKYIDYFDVTNKEDKAIIGKYYNNLASAYLRSNIYDKAISTYHKASLFDASNYITQAKIYTNQAIAFRMKGQFSKCYDALLRGKDFAYRSKDLEQMSFSHAGLAKYHEFRSDYRAALAEDQKAIELLIPAFSPKDDFTNPKPEELNFIVHKVFLLSFLSDKVKMMMHLGKEKYKRQILELFKLGDLVIDDMRGDHFIDDTKLYWRSEVFPFYEDALNYCQEEKAYDEAFYFFEKSKSVLLQEGYSFNEAISKTTDKDKDRYQKLKIQLNKIQKGKDFKSIDKIVNAQRSFELFMDSLSVTYPHLFKKYKKQFLLSLSEFQKEFVLDSSIVYIHYFCGEEDVFAFGIKHDKIDFLNLGKTRKIDSLITNLNYFFQHPAQIDNNFRSYAEASQEVYFEVLEPLVGYDQKEIVVLPDGLLATIPFESLISAINDEGEYKYVIQDKIVRYSFSGSILSNMDDSEYREPYDVVTFVPFTGKRNTVGSNFSGVQKMDFKSASKNGLNVKHFVGDEASKQTLFSMDDEFSILHFSSHGFEDEGKDPEILLANSSITLPELFTSSLPSDLVFLSACKTNLGKNSYGEGIQSMARGFTFAGANSVISSLWNVIADPNSNIVRRFYENLSLGQSKHLALHNAKVAYLEDVNIPTFEKSPYYWAGLVYYGESDHILKPKRENGNYSIQKYLIGALFLVLLFFGLKTYQRGTLY